MKKPVIFDLDGTLVDSAPDIHAATNALLRAMGYQPLSLRTVRGFIGNGIPKLVERAMRASDIEFTTARHKGLCDQFEAIYRQRPAVKSALYPGVREALETLRAQGRRLGICTNKNLDLTHQIIEALELAPLFDAVVGGDSLDVKKPDPAPYIEALRQLGVDAAIYVGDSEIDAATAKAAKAPFALFTEGYRKAAVAAIPHDFAFSDYERLVPMIEAMEQQESAA